MRKVVVIGAGAAGMMAAISAAKHGAHTVVLEHKDRVGKKILSTGNGRCNFTNLVQTPQCYRSDDPKFPWRVITQFDEKKTVEFFQNIGVYAKNRNGYLYPNSDQAGAVLDSLRMEMERLCVEVHTETEVLEIIPKKNRFVIRTGNGNVTADRVILAAGSKAAPVTGSDGSGYAIAKKMGHRIVPVLPALVQGKILSEYRRSAHTGMCIFICGWGLCLSGYWRNSADSVWYFRDSGISGQSFCSKGALQQTGSNSGLKFYASDV